MFPVFLMLFLKEYWSQRRVILTFIYSLRTILAHLVVCLLVFLRSRLTIIERKVDILSKNCTAVPPSAVFLDFFAVILIPTYNCKCMAYN